MTQVDLLIRGVPVHVWQADTQAEMQNGLLGVPHLDDDEGFMLPSGSGGLHTVGMLMSIDVVWLDAQGKTLAVVENIPPGKMIPKQGAFAIELQGGWFARHPPKQITAGADCGCGCKKNIITTPHGPMMQMVGQSMARSHGRSRALPSLGHGYGQDGGIFTHIASGPHMGPPPHGGGHPHGGHPHPHPHGGRRNFWGNGWGGAPWWVWAYPCDPCNPTCLDYDPTLDCSTLF